MIGCVADTHTLIWYIFGDPRLFTPAKLFMDAASQRGEKIAVSVITLIEIVYLIEKNKIPAETFSRLTRELDDPEGALEETPLTLAVARMMSRVDGTQIPDMPDRIIAATALYHNVPLVSRDSRITLSTITTIW
jgi:PIN domain nuclease of toxin-antitoxin system